MIIRNLYLVLLCFVLGMQAQTKIDLKLTNKVTVNRDSDYVYAYTLPEPSTFSAREETWYHWYSGGTIKTTRGGYDGKLLNGKFSCFYHNKNLEEQGQFKKGIKVGKWMSWYPSGELRSISHWRKGRQVGRSYHYNEQHQLVRVYKYRRGEAILKHPKPASKKKVAKDTTAKAAKKQWWNPFKKNKGEKAPKVKKAKKADPSKTATVPDGNAPTHRKDTDRKEKKARKDRNRDPKDKTSAPNPPSNTPIPVQKDQIPR